VTCHKYLVSRCQCKWWLLLTVCYSEFLSRYLKNILNQDHNEKWPKHHQSVLLGVLNDEFVAGLTGFMATHLPWSHFLSSSTLSLLLLCFGWCNFWTLISSHLENLEKSGNLSGHGKVRENGQSQRKVRENVFLHVWNLANWFLGKSLKLLPPDVRF